MFKITERSPPPTMDNAQREGMMPAIEGARAREAPLEASPPALFHEPSRVLFIAYVFLRSIDTKQISLRCMLASFVSGLEPKTGRVPNLTGSGDLPILHSLMIWISTKWSSGKSYAKSLQNMRRSPVMFSRSSPFL